MKPDTKWIAGWNKIVKGWNHTVEQLEGRVNQKVKEKWCEKSEVSNILRKLREIHYLIEEQEYKTKRKKP